MLDLLKIKELTNRIVIQYHPDKIVLFGSYAEGTQQVDSDLDILIVKDTNQPLHQRGFELRMSLIDLAIPIDLLIYTNSEFMKEKANPNSFLHTALKKSEILYERAN
jgi:predicted nucleotidyltransferase